MFREYKKNTVLCPFSSVACMFGCLIFRQALPSACPTPVVSPLGKNGNQVKISHHCRLAMPHTTHATPARRHTPLRPAAVDVTAPRTLSLVSVIKCFKFQMHSTLNAKKVKYQPTKPHPQTPTPSARVPLFFCHLAGWF